MNDRDKWRDYLFNGPGAVVQIPGKMTKSWLRFGSHTEGEHTDDKVYQLLRDHHAALLCHNFGEQWCVNRQRKYQFHRQRPAELRRAYFQFDVIMSSRQCSGEGQSEAGNRLLQKDPQSRQPGCKGIWGQAGVKFQKKKKKIPFFLMPPLRLFSFIQVISLFPRSATIYFFTNSLALQAMA